MLYKNYKMAKTISKDSNLSGVAEDLGILRRAYGDNPEKEFPKVIKYVAENKRIIAKGLRAYENMVGPDRDRWKEQIADSPTGLPLPSNVSKILGNILDYRGLSSSSDYLDNVLANKPDEYDLTKLGRAVYFSSFGTTTSGELSSRPLNRAGEIDDIEHTKDGKMKRKTLIGEK